MLKIILIVIALLIAIVLVLAARKPDKFRVERATRIKASPDKVFALINDFNRWGSWSPWEKMDPAMQRTFSGAASGEGSVYEWKGNKVGQGRMEILESEPSTRITIKLDFVKPFEAHNLTDFKLDPQGDETAVTWTMQGPAPFVTKIMHVFMDMDRMVGKDFAAGLENMKTIAEK
ncbi:MAG: SRPBCC family protein [Dokdonella sp.]